jgi:putative photosynthetic complex assembly protein
MTQERTNTGLYFDAEARKQARTDKEFIPKRLVYAMFGLALATLGFVSFSVLTDRPHVGVPAAAGIVAEADVIIHDGAGTKVSSADGSVLYETSKGSFITVVRDGLHRARLQHGVSGNPAVTITSYENGRVALLDPATGWRVELSSFGAGNAAVFAQLLR